jgi:hypothetical protein
MNAPPGRSRLLRDVIVLQIKLMADALRDIIISPIALVAGVCGLVVGRPPATQLFYGVVRFGRRTETWIDPFNAGAAEQNEQAGLDEVLDRIHAQLVEEYERGGVSAAAKRAIDQAVQVLSSRRDGDRPGGGDA